MQKHTKIYLKHFSYTTADFIPCECCGAKAVDLHHIECRGMGGSMGGILKDLKARGETERYDKYQQGLQKVGIFL